jgi:fructose-specific phosphotransferase system IIC component
MVIALLAGFVATLMVRTGLVLSFLKDQDAFGGFLLAWFLGGFSERWVSKSLRSLEELPETQSPE